jgi:hypothetical protein
VEHRDKPNEGRRPSQQGHVNEHASDRDQKVQTHGARHFEGAGGVRAARPPLRARDRNRRRTRNHGRGPVREKRMAAHARDGCAHRIVEVVERTELVRRRMARRAASSTPCKPHLVWCTSITSRVPRRRCEITKERRTSSVTRPPALRKTCASPGSSPKMRKTSMRVSMQVTTTLGAR